MFLLTRYRLPITSRRTSGWPTVRRYAWRRRKRFWSTLPGSSQWWTRSHSRKFFRQLCRTWLRGSPRTTHCRYVQSHLGKYAGLRFYFITCAKYRFLFSVVFQIVANSFLANLSTSALFATILVEYLLERLPEMGSNVELSNLYLKLFKLVFGSVSLFAAENEQMLKVSGCFVLLYFFMRLFFSLSFVTLYLYDCPYSPSHTSTR